MFMGTLNGPHIPGYNSISRFPYILMKYMILGTCNIQRVRVPYMEGLSFLFHPLRIHISNLKEVRDLWISFSFS